jgi:threonine aldolase
MRSLASDNYAGAHPAILEAIAAANVDHAPAYGSDAVTARAIEMFRDQLGSKAEVFFTFNGTGSNVIGLQSLMHSWEAVICASSAHINVDEAGAPEKMLGSKIISLPTPDGKLTPEHIESVQWRQGDVHQSQPKVVLITQSTESGTRYSPEEVRAIADISHDRGLYLYMDGARIANAAAGLGVELRAFTTDAGVDAMSFGGTKNGAMTAEAVVLLNPDLNVATDLGYIRKQYMQLSSKMRFTAAQFIALFTDDLWRSNALHANAMAQRLAVAVRDIPGVAIQRPVEANGVFAIIPANAIAPLQEHTSFYVWDEVTSEVRWLCSWDTTEADIDSFADAVKTTLAS